MNRRNKRTPEVPERPSSVRIERATFHSGLLPSPDVLQKHEQVLPGLVERIMCPAENQHRHRPAIVTRILETLNASQGLSFAFGMSGMATTVIGLLQGAGRPAIFAVNRRIGSCFVVIDSRQACLQSG